MGTPAYPVARGEPAPSQVDTRSLWTGGLATALVAALVAVVGVLVARGLLGIPVLAPKRNGAFGDVTTIQLALLAAASALVATVLLHVLLLAVPRPLIFFGWIVALATAAMSLLPFAGTAALEAKLATSIIYLLIGLAIGSLLTSVASWAIRRSSPTYRTLVNPY
jgi:drug/metabolite transporter (DMT)-like permease